jgi:hypothetical protein
MTTYSIKVIVQLLCGDLDVTGSEKCNTTFLSCLLPAGLSLTAFVLLLPEMADKECIVLSTPVKMAASHREKMMMVEWTGEGSMKSFDDVRVSEGWPCPPRLFILICTQESHMLGLKKIMRIKRKMWMNEWIKGCGITAGCIIVWTRSVQ